MSGKIKDLKPQVPFCYNSYIMKKSIMKLTNKVGASLALHPRVGTKRSVVLIAADKVGLIQVLDSKSARCPLNLELNFLFSFIGGLK